MRRFNLVRNEDETGISGTGNVAQGIQFDTGRCAMAWLTSVSSIAVYDSIEDIVFIHGHNGKTLVEWVDSE